MAGEIIYYSSNQSSLNILLSESDAQDLFDTSLVSSFTFSEFDNTATYSAGNVVHYSGIMYFASTGIASGGGTPLVNTNWRQVPTWGSYTTTATAAGTTTLTVYSAEIQRFTGTTTETISLPVTSTLPALGKPYIFINDSTGNLTVNSSGGNLVATVYAGGRVLVNCILLSGTTAASWAVTNLTSTVDTEGSLINSATSKTTPVDADYIGLMNSSDSNKLYKLSWANNKATLKTYFDTLYTQFLYTTTATAAGTTTLTVSSNYYQFFTGATTQTVVMPVTSTLTAGQSWEIYNNSTGAVTVQSSGANTIIILAGGTKAKITCILTSGTSAASWDFDYKAYSVTSNKKLSVSNSLTLAGTDGKTLTVSNSITVAGTDSTVMTFPSTSATIARTDSAQTFSGTQTFSGIISATGGAVKFPATQVPDADANTLDDYEEGTFTPGVSFGNGTTGITYGTQDGKYRKIGSCVLFKLYVVLTSKGSSTGAARATGLPFTSGSGESSVATYGSITNTGMIAGYVEDGGTVVRFQQISTAGAQTNMTDADFTNTSEFHIAGWYDV
jgi:hypothetical protein